MSSLSDAQLAVLRSLAALEPRFALTGGGALVAVHLGHRTTRDLDLFFHDLETLGRIPDRALSLLRASGLDASIDERFDTFCRVFVRFGDETVSVDLVADPVATIERPVECTIGEVKVLVDSRREIVANKLCALVGRSELRDLIDLETLLGAEVDLASALADAAAKDGGFSPLVLTWSLKRFPLSKVAAAEGMGGAEIERIARFRDELIVRIARLTSNESSVD